MNEELNKKLAEWAGFRYKPDELCGSPDSPHVKHSHGWSSPDLEYFEEPEPPDFTQSLDACFKWLVPKVDAFLQGRGGLRAIEFVYDEQGIACLIWTNWYEAIRNEGWVKTEPISLCLAIEKLISEKDETKV